MDAEWVKSAAARRIFVHWADARPAWLWSADGGTLLWRNLAARLFGGKIKKSGLKLAPDAVPIKGQVARLLRLGSPGRSSLARIQFLAGGKPASSTCTVTPLELGNGLAAVLIVGVDAIEPEVLAQPLPTPDPVVEALFPEGAAYLLIDPEGIVVEDSPGATERLAGVAAAEADEVAVEVDGETLNLTRYKASPQGHQLVLIEGRHGAERSIAKVRAEEGIGTSEPEQATAELLLPMGLPPAGPGPAPEHGDDHDTGPQPEGGTLSSLFDRLAGNEALYGELTAADEGLVPQRTDAGESAQEELEPPQTPKQPEDVVAVADVVNEGAPSSSDDTDVIAAVIEYDDDLRDETPKATMYRVTGQGFTPLAAGDTSEAELAGPETAAEEAIAEPPQIEVTGSLPPAATEPPPAETVERTSRYNFDELSRILTDRVSESAPPSEELVEIEPPIEPVRPSPAVAEGALINIAAETFILNRLPLGIMVFRDQQILFANRALTDLVGYETADSLRAAGISAIFAGDEAGSAGPVTHLVRRDGAQMPVTARLQSISWQGRPALLLSASASEPVLGHEAAVRTFAELAADIAGLGFLASDRSGVITAASPAARTALRDDADLREKPLASLIHPDDRAAFAQFLERPARFAETARPSIALKSTEPGVDLIVFAEGQAGIIKGYFGFVRPRPAALAVEADGDEAIDPAILARVSRGVRRPLNTIIGFADLIRSAAFGTIENHRYLEYARDIKTAGQEIAVLVDELDEYARLKEGTYAARPAELDLGALLESCIVRVRGQAAAAHVLVRSAISERLGHIRADRASLGQAVLNLLASAIDQTPAGGSVILSATIEEDGEIIVNVRDSGSSGVDPGERFVVFRDGVGKDGEPLAPVRSSVGLALTRSLVAVNACKLSVETAGPVGTLFSLVIPADLVAAHPAA